MTRRYLLGLADLAVSLVLCAAVLILLAGA